MNSYNRAVNTINNGSIKRSKRRLNLDEEIVKEFDKSLNDFYSTNKNYKKAKSLVLKYNMTSWDELARKNEHTIRDLRKRVEKNV